MTNGPGYDDAIQVHALTPDGADFLRHGFRTNDGTRIVVPYGRVLYFSVELRRRMSFDDQLAALLFFRENGHSADPAEDGFVHIDFKRNDAQSCCLIGGGRAYHVDINVLVEALIQARGDCVSTQPPGGPAIH